MTRNAALTVRLPGVRIAPASSTWTWGHTRLENSGINGFSRCSILAGRVRIITSRISQIQLAAVSKHCEDGVLQQQNSDTR
jgi:hypothetical protein